MKKMQHRNNFFFVCRCCCCCRVSGAFRFIREYCNCGKNTSWKRVSSGATMILLRFNCTICIHSIYYNVKYLYKDFVVFLLFFFCRVKCVYQNAIRYEYLKCPDLFKLKRSYGSITRASCMQIQLIKSVVKNNNNSSFLCFFFHEPRTHRLLVVFIYVVLLLWLVSVLYCGHWSAVISIFDL